MRTTTEGPCVAAMRQATHLHLLMSAQERPAQTGLTQDACQVGGQRAQREAPQERR